MRKLIIGTTGASGAAYFRGLLEQCDLVKKYYDEIYVIYTDSAIGVYNFENDEDLLSFLVKRHNEGCVSGFYSSKRWDTALASSSGLVNTDMVIVPCSMNTVARLAHGIQDNLLTRAALSVLRMGGKLVIVPRETPLSIIDLDNLYRLARYGVYVLPASPGFYHRPRSVSDIVIFIVGKILDVLGIEHGLYRRWQGFA